jgi:hypothetical protein
MRSVRPKKRKSITAQDVLGLPPGSRCSPRELVQSYRNLNQPGVIYSVRSKTTGRVVAHAPRVVMDNAELRVQQGGRARVLREKTKNVHAYVEGCWGEESRPRPATKIRYNPYLFESFVRADTLEPVHEAESVVLDEEGAWARKPR